MKWLILFTAIGLQAASVQLAIDPQPGIAGYTVSYGSPEPDKSGDIGPATNAYVSGLDPDRTYVFAARAFTEQGIQSALSQPIKGVAESESATFPKESLPYVQDTRITKDGFIAITWTNLHGLPWEIQRSQQMTIWEPMGIAKATEARLTFMDKKPNGRSFYRLRFAQEEIPKPPSPAPSTPVLKKPSIKRATVQPPKPENTMPVVDDVYELRQIIGQKRNELDELEILLDSKVKALKEQGAEEIEK